MKLDEVNQIVNRHGKLRRVLVPVDFTPASLSALRYAGILAEQFDSTIYLLHVVETHPLAISAEVSSLLMKSAGETTQDATEQLNRLAQEELASGLSVKPLVRQGTPAREILDAAASLNIDLIVMSAHRRSISLGRLILGSTVVRVERHASCPVLVVRCAEDSGTEAALWRERRRGIRLGGAKGRNLKEAV